MATEIQSLRPSIGEFNISGGSNDAYAKMGQSIKQIGQLAQAITDPIAEGIMAEEAQTNRLAEEASAVDGVPLQTKGTNPIFGMTKWGKSYAEAYNTLDTQLIAHSAVKELNKASIEASKPQSLRGGATIGFDKAADEIIQGYTSVAHGDKTKLRSALLTQANKLEMSIAQKEEEYALGEIKASTDAAFADMGDAMFQAGLDKDAVGQAFYAEQMKDNLRSRYELGFIHEADMEQGIKKIDASVRDSGYLATVLDEVRTGGNPDKALADIAKNPPPDMTYLEHQELLKNAKNIIDTDRIAQAGYHAQQGAQVEADIAASRLTDKTQLEGYDLTLEQQLGYEVAIDKANSKNAANQIKVAKAQADIANGQAAGIPKETVSSMAESAWSETEFETGQPLTMMGKYISISGGVMEPSTEQSEGAYIAPASGIPGVSLGTNVPSFDRIMSSALTSKDPRAMMEASGVYQVMLAKNAPNTIKLEGDAQRSAVLMHSLMQGGVDPLKASQQVSDTVLNPDPTALQMRLDKFGSANNKRKLSSSFEDAFDVSSSGNDGLYTNFVNQVRTNYGLGLDYDDAVNVAKTNMSNYQTSKYFAPNTLGQFAPEQNVPTLMYERDNMMALAVQGLIDNGATGVGGAPIKWADESSAIDLKAFKPEDWVDKPLPAVERRLMGGRVIKQGYVETDLPTIDVDGHKSKVYLISGDRVQFGDKGRFTYSMGYVDENGMMQPITYLRGPNMIATFTPVPTNEYAPNFFNTRTVEDRRKLLKRASDERYKKEFVTDEVPVYMDGAIFSEAEAKKIEKAQEFETALGQQLEARAGR